MKYLSVCSGIEAATVAWHPLGWTPLAFAEIDDFPRAVLRHHYPDTPLFGDFTALRHEPWIVDADVLVGGTPCQAFSIAGLRGSLSDERGNLSLEFIRLANAVDDLRRDARRAPAYVLWENVPGVLSVSDNAFGSFLAGLVGHDAAIKPPRGRGWTNSGVVHGPRRVAAWRVLDAQYFGLAQRRRRVFVLSVGHPRGWACADALLPIIDSLSGHPAPRREAGKGVASCFTPRAGNGSRPVGGNGNLIPAECDGVVNALTANNGQRNEVSDVVRGSIIPWPAEIAPTLNAHFGDKMGLEDQHALHGAGLFVPAASIECATGAIPHALKADGFDASEDGTGRGTPLVPVAYSIMPMNSGKDYKAREVEVAQPLMTSPVGGNQGGDFVVQPVAFTCKDSGQDAGEVAPTLRGMGHEGSWANGGGQVAVAWAIGSHAGAADGDQTNRSHAGGGPVGSNISEECAYSLRNGRTQNVGTATQVRRLTPRECERLQGFPDDYTLIPVRGKPAADGPRYKALGNSMAVPVMRWIGERIAKVDKLP